MRASVVAFGAALVIVGAALWFVPLASASSHITVPVGYAYRFGATGEFLVGAIPFTAKWTSSAGDSVSVYACGTNSACPNERNGTLVAHGVGATGSVGWSSRSGQYYLLVPSADSNVTITYLEPVEAGLAGIGVLGVGVLVLVAGVAMGRKSPSAPDGTP